MSKLVRRVMFVSLVATAGVLGACSSGQNYPGHSKVASNLTPDMMGLTTRPIDKNNNYTLTTNSNWRMFWDDLGRASLLDRPSHLTAVPLSH